MPISSWPYKLPNDPINFNDPLSEKEIDQLICTRELKVLQFSTPNKPPTIELLNNKFFPLRPDVTLRAWGFVSSIFDLSFSKQLKNVRHFSADSIMQAINIESVAEMENLESLGIGIYNLTDFQFLNSVSINLKKIMIERTKSKKPSLSHLRRFENLRDIYLEGQQKDIEVLSELPNIEKLVLRSISTPDVSYIRNKQKLWSLAIKLGGISDLRLISEMQNIKYLELWQIRGLSDINFIQNLCSLQYLFLQNLRNITALPRFSRLLKLRRLYLENLENLQDISSLDNVPALQEFIHCEVINQKPEDYLPLLQNKKLKRVFAGFGSTKLHDRFNNLLEENGIERMEERKEFVFL
jgi:hypothetical protein